MQFLIISQKAIPTPDFNLKDLPGHGRIDIIARCILAATRPILNQNCTVIHCFLKGGAKTGWLTWYSSDQTKKEDEISIASRIQDQWDERFTKGSLEELLEDIEYSEIVLLDENGSMISEIKDELSTCLFVLGAQQDISEEDKMCLEIKYHLSLGTDPMLASHAIIYLRQLYLSLQI